MATAAFKSTSRRTSIGGVDTSNSTANSNSRRRSRSVSRFSHRQPADENSIGRAKFVNTVRGSEYPEISLDDLAIEMFSMTTSSLSDVSSSANNNSNNNSLEFESGRRGRSINKSDDVDKTTGSLRRGRSVSRRGSRVSDLRTSNNNNISNAINSKVTNNSINTKSSSSSSNLRNVGCVDDGSVRRRRSLSVAPRSYSIVSDSEKTRSRADSTHQKHAQKPTSSSQLRGLRRCNSQQDLLRSYDGYTSYSSTLTDDEGNDARYFRHEFEKGAQASSALDKGPHRSSGDPSNMLYKASQKEFTHSGRDNRIDVVQLKHDSKLSGVAINDGRRSADTDALKAVSTIRRNYKTKLEESEKRKEELLAEIMLEEERGKELKKIVGDSLPNAKEPSPLKRPMRGRKRSTDRTRVSKKLVEDADKIIEDFISSVEETDISSFDGERSDTSSIVGGIIKPMMHYGDIEPFRSSLRSHLHTGEMDGVVLPWLKWETEDAGTPLPGSGIKQHPPTPKTVLQDALEETTGRTEQEVSVNSKSSRGSWSPGIANSICIEIGETSLTGEFESCKNQLLSRVPRKSRVDIDDYLKPPSNDNILSEIWKQRDRIQSGGVLICHGSSFGKFLM